MAIEMRFMFAAAHAYPLSEVAMRTLKDVEAYLLRSNRPFTAVDDQPGTFLVASGSKSAPQIAVRVDPPLVVCRVHIGDVDGDHHVDLYRRLLALNAKALVHASYGLDENRIVLEAAHELENLDFNELEATLDEIEVALAQQVPELLPLAKKES